MASSTSARVIRTWMVGDPVSTGVIPLSLAPLLVVVILFKLAISDGGRHLGTLTLAQIAIFAALLAVAWVGAVRGLAVSRPLMGMLAVMALASIGSVRPEASVRELLLWTMYVGLCVITASTLSSAAAAERFVDAAVFVASWLCLIGLFMFWGANNPGMRWSATFYWPNPFAAFLLLVLPVEVSRCLHARRWRASLAHGAICLLLAVALVLTYSRGAWLGLLMIIPVALIVLHPPSWKAALWRCAVLAALTALSVVVLTRGAVPVSSAQGVIGRAASLIDAEDTSVQGRLNFWRSGIAIFLDHPLIGTGPGTFGAVHAAYQRDVRFYAKDAHNLYIQTAAEMGLVGIAALVTLLSAVAVLWVRSLRQARGRGEYPVIAGIGLGLAAFLLHSGLEMDWMFPANPAMAFALVGVLAWYDRAAVEPRAPSRATRRAWGQRAAVLAMLGALVVTLQFEAARRQFVEGQSLARMGQWSAAADRYARATQWNPLSPRYLSAQASALAKMPEPRLDAAVALTRRAMALDRMNASHPFDMARLILAHRPDDPKRQVEVTTLLRQALALDPVNRPEAYRFLAQLHRHAGEQDQAERLYREAVTLYRGRELAQGMLHILLWPEVAGLYLDWADFLASEQRLGEATEVLRSVLVEDPAWVPAYLGIAELYVRQGRFQDADRILDQGMKNAPTSEALWVRWRTLPSRRTPRYER